MSIPRLCLPVATLALAACGLCLWINLSITPWASEQIKNTIYQIVRNNPLSLFSSDQVISEFPGKKIYVGKKEGPQLFNVFVYEQGERDEPLRVVWAKRAELRADLENQQVLMRLLDARFEQRDASAPEDFSRIRDGIAMRESTFPIAMEKLHEENKTRRGVGQLTLDELRKDPSIPLSAEKARKRASALRTELHKRFSLSFASFSFMLVAVPLGITAHRKETTIGFLFSLMVAFAFFFFIAIADSLRENAAACPHLLMWVPNALFLSLGGWLFARMARR